MACFLAVPHPRWLPDLCRARSDGEWPSPSSANSRSGYIMAVPFQASGLVPRREPVKPLDAVRLIAKGSVWHGGLSCSLLPPLHDSYTPPPQTF